MAATGYTPISLYYSTTAAAVPLAANLVPGELAINITDGKLYFENNSGVVTLLAQSGAASPVTTFSAGTTGFTPSTATSGAVTLAGTLATTNGGTGLTSFTLNGLIYASSTSALSTNSALTFDGTNFATTGSATASRFIPSGSTVATNGMYLPAANSLGFSTNSTERMRLDSTGQVYINGTSGTALLTIAASNTYPALKVPNIVETANTVAGAPASTQTFYLGSGAVQYYTSNAANNWTVNFAMSAGTALNTAMAVGDSVSVTMLTTQGSTAYYNSSVQIDGTTSGVTTKWQGGTAPTSGNASSIDSYTYVIYKTASATYTVLASQTKFA
jgi:hypothetical protein